MKTYLILTGLFIAFISPNESICQQLLRPPSNANTYVIAHRGAHIGIPENSLPAYQKAIDLGCDFVEIDIRTTKDNEYVSIHNSTVDAYVEGKTGRVWDLTSTELKELDIGKNIGDQWKGTRVPTFEEILQLCQGKIGIYLDLKDADALGLIELIKKYNMEKQVVWCIGGSSHKTIMIVKQECPDCIPMPDPGEEKNLDKVMVAYKPKVVASVMRHYTKSFGKHVHERGALVFVDDSESSVDQLRQEWQKMLHWQVDGIQTDRPKELISFLKGK